MAGLATVRVRGRNGSRSFVLSESQIRLVQVAMTAGDTKDADFFGKKSASRVPLYIITSLSTGEIRTHAKKLFVS